MKSFLRNVVQRKDASSIVGKTVKLGSYTVKVDGVIGDGGFATIYRVKDVTTSSIFALKHVRLHGEAEAILDCQTEVNTMKQLRGHPNILTLRASSFLGVKGAEQEAYLLMDLCQGNLVDVMKERGKGLDNSEVVTIFHSVCKAVAAMHHQQPPLLHRDLKAENVLLHTSGAWVICDFGSATSWTGTFEGYDEILLAEENIRRYTTPAYRAPEMHDLYSRERIDEKADIWALGVLLYYLCYTKLPFSGDNKLEVLDSAQVLNADVALPSSRPQPVLMLLRQILSTRPADRPDADAILAQLELWSTQGFAGSKAKPSQSDEAAPRAVHPAVPQKNGSWTTGWETDMWEDGRSPVTDVDGVQQRLDSSASAASATSSSGPSIRAAADSNALSVAQPLEASFDAHPEAAAWASPTKAPSVNTTSQHSTSAGHPERPITSSDLLGCSAPSSPLQTQHIPGPPQSYILAGSKISENPEVLLLRQQLADAHASIAGLNASLKSQQVSYRKLQVANYNQAAMLKRLQRGNSSGGLSNSGSSDALGSAGNAAPPATAEAGPWFASFSDTPGSTASPTHASPGAGDGPLVSPINATPYGTHGTSEARLVQSTKLPADKPKNHQPLAGLDASLSHLDPFAASPCTEATVPLRATAATAKGAPAMRGGPLIELSCPPDSGLPLHRRTSSEPTPVESWTPQESWL